MKRVCLSLMSYVLIHIMLLFCYSCSESTPEPTITGDSRSVEITSQAGTESLSFSTNYDWNAEVDASWIQLSQTQGPAGDFRLTISIDANLTYDARTATITVTAGTASLQYVITQKQRSGYVISTTEFSIGSSGGNLVIPIKANVNYAYEVDDACKSWLSITQTKSLSESQLNVSVMENKSYDQRSGKIYISYENERTTLTIDQSQLDELIIEKKEFKIDSEGGQIIADVKSNINYTCEILDEAKEWISLSDSESRGLVDSRIILNIKPNENENGRVGQIKVYGDSKESFITITQYQKDMLIINQTEYNISERGGMITIPVQTNLTYEVIVNDTAKKWLHVIDSRSLERSEVEVSVDKNNSYKIRSGKIVIRANSMEKNITITQSKQSTLIIPDKVDLGLSVKWASFNLGTTIPEDPGQYYAWGELKGYYNDLSHAFYWNNYLSDFGGNMSSSSWAGTANDPLRSYVYPNYVDLDNGNDAAYNTFGDKWRMPSAFELKELISNCTINEGTMNGVSGYYFTSKINQNRIFIPVSGYISASNLRDADKAYFWTASPGKYDACYGTCWCNTSNTYYIGRSLGMPIRPVYGQAKSVPSVMISNILVEQGSVTFKGIVNATNGLEITKKGFVYSTKENVSLENGKVLICESDNFTSVAENLSPSTTYYVKAYAENKLGIGYSATKKFVTKDVEYMKIASASDLNKFAEKVRTSTEPVYAALVSDITLSSWTPIGTESKPFKGVFNGNYYTVNITNCKQQNTAGLFGVISQATIKNLYLSGNLNGQNYLGAVAGKAHNSIIDNCLSKIKIVSGSNIGGIVGTADKCIISNCSHQENSIGEFASTNVGGIVGESLHTEIYNCFNTGNIFGNDAIGGIVGDNSEGSSVTNCYNKGHFKDMIFASMGGGIVGRNAGNITNSYSSGTMKPRRVSGDEGYVFCGGVIGYNDTSAICQCCYFLQQYPINVDINYIGMLNWGECTKCGSFDGSGTLKSSSLSHSGNTRYLRNSLNEWVDSNNSEGKYKKWDQYAGWPGFVY